MKPLWAIADFLRDVRRRTRFGELSRAPLRLLRVELKGSFARCDWMVRPADPWDAAFCRIDRERSVSQQALCDALNMRDLIFAELPNLEEAFVRGFRPSEAREPLELVIAGCLSREPPEVERVSSLAMKAKLHGLHFHLEEGVLQPLESKSTVSETQAMDFISL